MGISTRINMITFQFLDTPIFGYSHDGTFAMGGGMDEVNNHQMVIFTIAWLLLMWIPLYASMH